MDREHQLNIIEMKITPESSVQGAYGEEMLHPLAFCSWTGETFERRPLRPFAGLHVLLHPGQSGGCETGGCDLESIGDAWRCLFQSLFEELVWPEMASHPEDPWRLGRLRAQSVYIQDLRRNSIRHIVL